MATIGISNRQGPGTHFYKNGDKYAGSFSGDVFDGRGELELGSLDVYKGDFVGGVLQGNGTMEYKVRAVRNAPPCEEGWIQTDNVAQGGHTYVGQWRNWTRRGEGEVVYRNGDRHTGIWDGESGEARNENNGTLD